MGVAYKNFWSLNTDEAVVTGILRNNTPKNIEVFIPVNAQMKDIDLILVNLNNKKSVTIQVKGSRAYEPSKTQVVKYGSGSGGWFYFHKNVIMKNTSDYFVFLVYILEENHKLGRRIISPHVLTMPTYVLKQLCKKYKKVGKGSMYNFFLWIDPKKKRAFEFRDKVYYLNKYLDKRGFELLTKKLK